ncbi:MAG: CHRD domain-containing protein, partial [Elainellaceae cyanobacterium]
MGSSTVLLDNAAQPHLIALTSENTLISFSPENLTEVTEVAITGIEGTLLGIDVRPADGQIYGITTANQIYTLDPDGFASGTFDGSFTLTEEEEALLLQDALYLNLHTEDFNSGELRGQVDVELENDIVATGLVIEEAQEVGEVVPPDGPAMGAFNVIYDDATNTLTISGSFSDLTSPLFPVGDADGEGNPQSAVHLHNGVAGENGPIIRNFTVGENSFEGSFTLTEAEEALLLADALYVNLHTENFNGGELRGQVDVELDGDV